MVRLLFDWSAGEYELTAAELAPVAEHVLTLAAPAPGDRVLDVACGTGNAALLAAGAGAEVTGLDSAARLVEVARSRAAEAGVSATFVVGDAQDLPFADASFDLALSVFGVIFAPQPGRALAELARVLRPGGRAFVTAWVPAGPIDAMVGAFVRALPGPPRQRFPWHERDAVAELAGQHGAAVTAHDGELTITAESPEAYLERGRRHPMSVAMGPALEQAGTAAQAHAEALAALRAGNEDPGGFRVRSPYRVLELRLPG
ncbi:MAG TPA: methyltransferase domain-containing protein [Solirubrobacteraceae bacterium]|nr:methyltransferase domain-containing protein [Solirubrobacteraceae bacterium]